MENKAETYRKMLAFLEDKGATLEDLGPHSEARLARAGTATLADMDNGDLMHYQRVLEATIDSRDAETMDKEAMRDELTQVVRERFQRGTVADKTEEAKEFRARLASL